MSTLFHDLSEIENLDDDFFDWEKEDDDSVGEDEVNETNVGEEDLSTWEVLNCSECREMFSLVTSKYSPDGNPICPYCGEEQS